MKNALCLGSLAVALLGLGVVRGQQPTYPPAGMKNDTPANGSAAPSLPPVDGAQAPAPSGPGSPYPGGLSQWLLYPRPCACCGPVGKNGPLGYEVYLRTGVSFPMGDGALGKVMEGGFMIQGGGRTLFFNPTADAAWTLDFGLASVFLDAGDSRESYVVRNFEDTVPSPFGGQDQIVIIPELRVTPSSINQTYVQLGFGRETWLLGCAEGCDQGLKWRVGWDVGGRWGTARLVRREVLRADGTPVSGGPFTDVVGGCYVSLHTDMEIPCGCCIFQYGVRAEFGYIWSDILQRQNDADLQSINVLFNAGLRF